MNRFLPDVNVLLALLDPTHVHHEAGTNGMPANPRCGSCGARMWKMA
jgi:hypothetical protein